MSRSSEQLRESGHIRPSVVIGALGAIVAGAAIGGVTIVSAQNKSAEAAFTRQYIVEDDCLRNTDYNPVNGADVQKGTLNGNPVVTVAPTDKTENMLVFSVDGVFHPTLQYMDSMTEEILLRAGCDLPHGK